MKSLILLLFGLSSLTVAGASSDKIVKDSIKSQNKNRTVYLFVPDSLKSGTPAPLIVLLHGSGRNGLTLAEKWKDLAAKEGIILAGPDSLDPKVWSSPTDGPDFLHDVVEDLKLKYTIDARRVYLFGHSGGAVFALYMSLLESEYFAAAAVHAGALAKNDKAVSVAKRKSPIAIFVGTRDPFFPLSDVRDTRDQLNKQGFAVELTEIAGHDHNYYDSSSKINQSAWDFLKKHQLPAEPQYEQYNWSR